MNDTPNPAEFALAMYATACESHQRRDWREACHALAKALKAEQLASASRATLATAAPMPEPVTPAPRAPAVKRAKASTGAAESFNMTAGSLAKAMRLVCRAVEKRNNGNQPILDNALIEARGDTLRVSGTNLDETITVRIEAPGVGEWSTTAGAHDLLAMLAKADKGAAVALAVDADSRLGVTIGRAVSQLPTLPAGDWPVMLDGAAWSPVDVDGAALISALAFIAPAMSTEETRYYLNGAFLGVRPVNGERRLHVVATDGHRLHKAEIDAPACDALDLATSTDEMGREYSSRGAILPHKAVRDLLAVAGDGDGLTFALAGEKGYQVTRGPVTLTSKLIDGSFPDYMRIIPTDSRFTIRADRVDLASKAAGVASVSKEKSRAVRFTAKGATLAMMCRNMEGGNAADVLEVDYCDTPAEGDEGEPSREWGFNALYVKEALASLCGDVVTFAGTAPSDPFKVTGADSSRLVVLMPLRV